MKIIKVKGYEINFIPTISAIDRKAVLYCNNIIEEIKKIGLNQDYVEFLKCENSHRIELCKFSIYYENHKLIFSHNSQRRYIDNLFILSKLVEKEIQALLNNQITKQNLIDKYTQEKLEDDFRNKAIEILDLKKNNFDKETLNKNYKELAKKFHPDKEGGSVDEFKKINNQIKKEEVLMNLKK